MKKFFCALSIHLAIFANVNAMKKAGESALEDHKRSFIASTMGAGVSQEVAEHLYFFDIVATRGGKVEQAQCWSILRGLAKGDKRFIEELMPHISSSLKGSGEDSLLSLAVKSENALLIKSIIDYKLCTFVRKKALEHQSPEQFPFLDNHVCGRNVRTLIKLAERKQQLVLDPQILSPEEMDQWEVVQ